MPQRKKLKNLLVSWVLLVVLFGCAHGNTSTAVSDASAPERAAVQETPAAEAGEKGLEAPAASAEAVENPSASESVDPAAPGSDPADLNTGEGVSPEDQDPMSDDGAELSADDFFELDNGEAGDLPAGSLETLVADPFIGFNRAMFAVNDKLYFWCLKPVARGYRAVTPVVVRKGVRNFFQNLSTPIRLVSSVFQGKIKGAGSELGRFVVNTTLGVGGVWDPAERFFGLKPSDEDLGQTLGSYNIGNGFYIVWPFLGPSTLRDTLGKAGDVFLNPLFYVNPNELAWGLSGLDAVNDTSFRIGDYETVKATYMDPYVMIRDLYIEHRKRKVAE